MTLVVISHYWGQHVSREAADGGAGAVTMKEAFPLMPACMSIPLQSGSSFLASSDRAHQSFSSVMLVYSMTRSMVFWGVFQKAGYATYLGKLCIRWLCKPLN